MSKGIYRHPAAGLRDPRRQSQHGSASPPTGSGCRRMRELAEERRRFDVVRLHVLLRREGLVVNHKRTERFYHEEGLSLRLRAAKKRPCSLRSWLPTPCGPDKQWGMDFVSDSLGSGRRIRILTILDLWDRSTPALEVDVSPSGQRVAQVRNAFACKGACRAGFGRTTARSSSVGH